MQNLSFDDGSIKLAMQGDPNRLLVFNPTDYNLAAKFYKLVENSEIKSKEIQEKAKPVDSSGEQKEVISFFEETDHYFKGELDKVFGEGSSKIIFADVNVMSTASNGDFVLSNFLMSLYPHFQRASKSKVKNIVAANKPKRTKK